MATSSSGGFVELDAKFLDRNEQVFRVFIPDAKKTASILHEQEVLGKWKDARPGDMIKVRVSDRFANDTGLLGEQTYGTGSKGKSMGKGHLLG